MATGGDEDHLAGPKMWQCGDPYQFPLPAGDGDHWEKLLAPLLERDNAQCVAWRDEVQNLLIFAGLFSGVLTAFAIESYQGLQPDPNAAMIGLLMQIATRLDNSDNSSSIATVNQALLTSSPAASSIRINIFWFMSLVLSLTTALVGIVSLQWLREHQQYPSSLSAKDKFALFNMRAEGLEAWYVPRIFSALPLLLQWALILFLVGLIDFLLASATKVAIPVVIVIGIPFAFLILTTVIPAIQVFVFCLPLAGRARKVPQQSPYKSPQSRLLRRFMTLSRHVFFFSVRFVNTSYSLVVLRPLIFLQFLGLKAQGSEKHSSYDDDDELKLASWMALNTWRSKSWFSFDKEWLTLRDAYAKGIFLKAWWMTSLNRERSQDIGPLYDLMRGMFIARSDSSDSAVDCLAYLAIPDLSSTTVGKSLEYDADNHGYTRYLQHFLISGDLKEPVTFSTCLENPSVAFMQDENRFIFLTMNICPAPSLLQHFGELHIRIMNYLYPRIPQEISSASLGEAPSYPNDQFLFSYRKPNWGDQRYGPHFDGGISEQLSLVIKTFFEVAVDQSIDDMMFLRSSHTRPFGEILQYTVLRQKEEAIPSILEILSTNLNRYMEGNFGRRSDFFFYASSFYVRSLLISDPWAFTSVDEKWDDRPVVDAFLPVLRQYLHARGTPDVALRKRLEIPEISDKWWGFLDRPQAHHRPNETEGKILTPEYSSPDTSPPDNSSLPVIAYEASPEEQRPAKLREKNNEPQVNPNAGDLV